MEGGARNARFFPSALLFFAFVARASAGGCYANGRDNYFVPGESETFELVKFGNVNLTFLDNTHLEGHDGQDYVDLGEFRVKTRFGMIETCSSVTFNGVDGILGFGWAGGERSAALLKTMTQEDRPSWDIEQDEDFEPMERKFAFTADAHHGEVQLGGYDPDTTDGEMVYFPMATTAYGVNVSSIKYGRGPDAVELLHFNPDHRHARTSYVGQFDSGTTCLLLPNSTGLGYLKSSPFQSLLELQMAGVEAPLVYTMTDVDGIEREYEIPYSACVEPTPVGMILGDPWFRGWVVMHDLTDLENPVMGLAPRNPDYDFTAEEATKAEAKGQVLMGGGETVARGAATSLLPAGAGGVARRALHSVEGRKSMEGHAKMRMGVEKLRATRTVEVPAGQTLAGVQAPGAVSKVKLEAPTRVVYDVTIGVGTPPQEMKVIFDTGSYMLAIFSRHPPANVIPLEGRGSIQKLKDLAKKGYKVMFGLQAEERARRRAAQNAAREGAGKLQKLRGARRRASEGPDVRKAMMIRKAIEKMRASGQKEARLRDLGIEALQVGAEGAPEQVTVSRVPAMIGINAVLVAAVVALAVRFQKRRSVRTGSELRRVEDEGYGALAQEQGASLL